jgi:hypothetical protein
VTAVTRLEAAVTELEQDTPSSSNSSRQRSRPLRAVAAADMGLTFYSFATLVAVTTLRNALDTANETWPTACGDNATLLQAVKRSRMTASTVVTFLFTNTERSLKAIREYAKGKAIQCVAAHLRDL